ncbi:MULTISPECIES: hypothetical protein [Mycobacterium]|uniref:hypothetical protein n=1 Tax=Mycobacterium TaxID=1763 RepID=UPI001057EE3A|nr:MULTISPECIES: hypothetical protein [Mycobacterium]MDM4142516.1 hypothetical protein [Mycobacterium sp. FLAC0960]
MIPFLRPLRLLRLVLIVAALQKAFGDGLIGMITATVAAWIVHRVAEEETTTQAATAAQIDELRAQIAQLTGLLTEAAGKPDAGAGAAATTPRATK